MVLIIATCSIFAIHLVLAVIYDSYASLMNHHQYTIKEVNKEEDAEGGEVAELAVARAEEETARDDESGPPLSWRAYQMTTPPPDSERSEWANELILDPGKRPPQSPHREMDMDLEDDVEMTAVHFAPLPIHTLSSKSSSSRSVQKLSSKPKLTITIPPATPTPHTNESKGGPIHPVDSLRDWCYVLATRPGFIAFINVCILANFVLLASEYEGMSDTYETGLELLNLLLIGVFMVEIGVNIMGFGWMFYAQPYNLMDAVVVVFSLVEATVAVSPLCLARGTQDSNSVEFI